MLICCSQFKVLTGAHCDKNINDGQRNTTHPMEMNSLLSGSGNTTQGTGTLSSESSRSSTNRVPQFSLNNVVFLQELGEGAFGNIKLHYDYFKNLLSLSLTELLSDLLLFRKSV